VALFHHSLDGYQIKGELKVEEVANASEEDDFIFTITVEGSGSEQVRSTRLFKTE